MVTDFGIRAWLCGLTSAVLLAAVLAAVPSGLDWLANPGDVFRGADGTHWRVVFETYLSWFGPLFLLLGPVTVLVFAWRAGRNGGDPCCRDCR